MNDEVTPTKKPRKKRAKETKPREMREKKLERQIIWALQMKGCVVAKSGEAATYNSHHVLSGMSDLIVFMPNKGCIFMEVKEGKGKQRESQVKFQALCESCGVKYVVVYSTEEAVDACK
jgi:hypothetical protein